MTSTNSSYKPKSKLAALFAETAKRYIPGAAVAFVIALIAVGGVYGIQATSYIFDMGEIDVTSDSILFSVCLFFGAAVYNLVAVIRMYSEIYSKQASDYYFSRPVSRVDIFNANFLFGSIVTAVIIAVPLIIYYAMVSGSSHGEAVLVINQQQYFKQLAVIVCSSLAVFSVLTLCAVIAGKKIHYFVLALISLVSTSVAAIGAVEKLNNIWGIRINENEPSIISPLYNYSQSKVGMMIPLIIALAEFLIIYAAGLTAFRKRRAECAQTDVSGNVLPCVMLAIITFSGFMMPMFQKNFFKTAILGFIIAVVLFFVFNAVFYKKAFTKKTAATFGFVCAFSLIFLGVIYFPSYDNFVSYIPQEDEIESVEYICDDFNGYYGNDLYSLFIGTQIEENEDISIEYKQTENIRKMLDFHKKMVSAQTIMQSIGNSDVLQSDSDMGICSCTIMYTLKDGRTVKRSYDANAKCIIDEYIAILKNEEALSQTAPFNEEDEVLFVLYDPYYTTEDETAFEEYGYSETDSFYVSDEYRLQNDNTVDIPQDMWGQLFDGLMADRLSETDRLFLYNQNISGQIYYDADDLDAYPESIGYISYATLSDGVSEDEKQKILKMTPQERQKYYEYSMTSDDIMYVPMEINTAEVYEADNNTIKLIAALEQGQK